MEYYKLIILTFIITAQWDVILRFLSLNIEKLKFPFPDFVKYLKPYFKHHTMLSAALIAGFIGATTQPIILFFMKFPSVKSKNIYVLKFMLLSFIISALFGFIMKGTKMFPYLDKHYYDNLGTIRGMYHDGTSGLIVQSSILILLNIAARLK
jgi:hypothetical protein